MCIALVTASADQRVSICRVHTNEAQLLAWVMCTLRRRPVRSHRSEMCLTVTFPWVESIVACRCVTEEQLCADPALQLCRRVTVLTVGYLWCGGLCVKTPCCVFRRGGRVQGFLEGVGCDLLMMGNRRKAFLHHSVDSQRRCQRTAQLSFAEKLTCHASAHASKLWQQRTSLAATIVASQDLSHRDVSADTFVSERLKGAT